MKSLCVFCGSSKGTDPAYMRTAEYVGRWCAAQSLTLIYGGARIGMMGAVADAALAEGGQVIGVIPRSLQEREIAHNGLTQLYLTDTMHERQKVMADLSDGFLVLPGGYGTLAEFFEVLTWKQIGLHAKPIAVLNISGYWDHLLGLLQSAGQEGFTRQQDQNLYAVLHDLSDIHQFFVNKDACAGKVLGAVD